MTDDYVGASIREWRQRRGMSQHQVAVLAGVSQAALSNYELGKRGISLSAFLGVAEALDIPIHALLGAKGVRSG